MGYGATARTLHWTMAILVILIIPAGLIMTSGVERGLQDALFAFHKSAGVIILLLLAFRIIWRLTHPTPPLPATVSPIQRIAAHATHMGLYLFLAIMAVSGYVRVTAGGFPIELMNALGIPPLLPRAENVAAIAKTVHAVAKYGLIALILLHVGAALMHGVVLRDGVLSRMWPPFTRGASPVRMDQASRR